MASEFTPANTHRNDTRLPALTLELALQIAIFCAALILRLFALDAAPLNSAEARQALSSFDFVHGNALASIGNPYLFTANVILFVLFTASDFTARLAPALVGAALVLTPRWLRRDLGRVGALIASALLAFSPSLVYFSRTLDGAMPAVLLILAAYAVYARYRETRVARDSYVAGAFAAVAALAAAIAWFDNASSGGSLVDVLRLLLVYEPLVLLFGLGGFMSVISARAENRAAVPLSLFVIIAIGLIAFGGDGGTARMVFLVVPLALMAGAGIGSVIVRLIEQARELGSRELLWHELPILGVVTGLVSFLSIVLAELAQRGNVVTADALTRFLGPSQDNPALANSIVMLLFLFAFIMAAILALTTLGAARALDLGTFCALVLLSFWTIRQTAKLNFADDGAYNPQEWIVARAASPNVRDLVRDLQSQSRWRGNDTHSINVSVDSALGSLVRWNLRNFRYAQFQSGAVLAPETQAVVTSEGAAPPPGAWIAQKYQIELTRGVGSASALRALIYRDVGSVQAATAILWVPKP